MPEKPPSNPADLPPIDTSKIKINIIELEAPDYQFDFTVPVDLVQEIATRIQDGALEYNELQMGQLIAQICIDEGMTRLDRDSVWGTRILKKSISKYSSEEPFIFSAVVDALPKEELQVNSIPMKRNKLQVDEALIDTEMHEQRLQFGTKTEFTGALAHGDEICCDASFLLSDEEDPTFTASQIKLRIPHETQEFALAGLPLKDIASQLRGCQSADELSFTVDFPMEYSVSALQGKTGTLTLDNCSFYRITPASIELVLEQYGTPNETILRAQIKMSLQHNFDRQNTNHMVSQLYEYLLENIDVPVSKRIINKRFEELCNEKLNAIDKEELTDVQKSIIMEKAERLVKRLTLNAWLQRTYQLSVSEDDVDNQAAIIAEERRVRPSEVKDEFLANDKIPILGNMAAERKILERLKDKFVFTDV